MSPRRGFTFIELLVVVAIIAALAGMSLAGLAVLRRQSKVASTLDLMTHITTAIDQYLTTNKRLGKVDSSDFINDPWDFLHKQQRRLKQPSYLELPLTRLVTKTGSGSCVKADAPQSATHITDHFGGTSGNVFSFTIYNHSKGGSNAAFTYAQCIILRSSAGSPSEPKDDLLIAFNSEKAAWRKIRIEDLEEFAQELDRSPKPILEKEWKDPLED